MTAAFRAEVRDWLAAHVPPGPLPSFDTAEGFERHRAWERELAAARLSVVTWPAAYGGRDATLADWLVFEEEYHAAGALARVGQNGLFLLAPALLEFGTGEQRDRLLARMAAADDIWAQAWSEPEAGSDLAALRSRAVRRDGGWLVSGTKTWCSRAAFADRAFDLFRTDPGPGRHHGLSYLMFGLRAPGVTVRPIRQLSGRTGFAEIALDEVFVPDRDVVGAPGDGWRIAMSTASHERGLSLRSPGRFLAADLEPGLGLWRRLAGLGVTALAVPEKRGGLGASPLDLDTTRSLASLAAQTSLAAGVAGAVARAVDFGALACSAQLLGAGRALLEASVRHARARVQFGRPVGAFQAVKHRLADVAIGLEFARPLADAAAAALAAGEPAAGRDVSAAKVACAGAAHRAARAALQVHGAIGYTAEHDLSRFLLQVRALVPAWGTAAEHRVRVLEALR